MTASAIVGRDGVHPRVSQILSEFHSPSASAWWLLCDRHPEDHLAFRFVQDDMTEVPVTYGDLKRRSQRAAAALARHGVGPGDRVAGLLGKGPDLPALLLGIWRLGAVYVPLFTAFAASTVTDRVIESGARVVVTDPSQIEKLEGHQCIVMLANVAASVPTPPPVLNFAAEVDRQTSPDSDDLQAGESAVGFQTPIVHMFTSGTTGRPKAVVHPLGYAAGWQAYLELALAPGRNFWCGADPGWAYGLYAGMVAPLAAGITSIMTCGSFKPTMAWEVMRALDITDFAAAPTAYRALRVSDPGYPLPHLRGLSSAGEPLTPEVGAWARQRLGADVHDHFGQTELGMTAGFAHHPDIRDEPQPGAMGRSLPGWSMAVLSVQSDDPADVDEVGRLAVNVAASPYFTFTGYGVQRDQRGGRFTEDGTHYITGDLASTAADGLIRFSSRDDDVIVMAGYRIGPFEIESVLLAHESVAEAAIVAVPDELRGEVIHAFVVLAPGVAIDIDGGEQQLTTELQAWVKSQYGAHAYPRYISFVEGLPKTPSGKVQRSLLRASLAPGDATPA